MHIHAEEKRKSSRVTKKQTFNVQEAQSESAPTLMEPLSSVKLVPRSFPADDRELQASDSAGEKQRLDAPLQRSVGHVKHTSEFGY